MWRALLAGLLLAAAASPGAAQGDEWSDRLVVPEGECLTHATLSDHLRSWLPGGLPATDPRRVLVELGPDERHEVAFVLTEGETVLGERRFATLPAECANRRAALSLAIAIALDAAVLEQVGVPPPAPQPAPPVVLERPPVPRPPPAEPEPPPKRLGFGARLDAGGGAGVLPMGHARLSLSLFVRGARWGLEIGGWASQRSRTDLGSGRLAVQAVAGTALACVFADPLRRVEMSGCAGVLVGAWLGEGEGYRRSMSDRAAWVAPVLALRARWPSDSTIALVAGARGLAAAVRPGFAVRDTAGNALAAIRASPVAAEASLGVEVTFR